MENIVPTEEFYGVSDNAHALGGCLAVLGPKALGCTHPVYCAIAIIIYAAVKEGLYDPKYETPIVAGSGWRDFFGYVVGVFFALSLLFVASRF